MREIGVGIWLMEKQLSLFGPYLSTYLSVFVLLLLVIQSS
jgi:hypothetical protein